MTDVTAAVRKGKWGILTTEVPFSPALILTSEHDQNGVLAPTLRLSYNVVRCQNSFRYIKIRSILHLIREFGKTQAYIKICVSCITITKLNVYILHVYLLDSSITRVRHCRLTERKDNASKYVFISGKKDSSGGMPDVTAAVR
jgi:hypothetical protein